MENAKSLTNRLLGFARGGKYEVRPVDLNTLVKKSIQIFWQNQKRNRHQYVSGKGTTFSILLPATEKPVVVSTPPTSTVKKGSGTILLVDDEPMITEIGSKILKVIGYDVLTAASGDEALDTYSANQDRIDLLILDMIMPGMSGGELFDKLKLLNPAVKVLLCSGYSIDGKAREILNRGCKGFIQKPFTVSGLSVKIRELLD